MRARLFLHVKRVNFIASIWKQETQQRNGWNEDGSLTWTSDIFPEEVEEILFDDEFDTNDYIDDRGESDDEEDI